MSERAISENQSGKGLEFMDSEASRQQTFVKLQILIVEIPSKIMKLILIPMSNQNLDILVFWNDVNFIANGYNCTLQLEIYAPQAGFPHT